MKLSIIVFLLIGYLVSIGSSFAGELPIAEQAKQILDRAAKQAKDTSYKTVEQTDTLTTTSYSRCDPDGFVLKRMELVIKNTKPNPVISGTVMIVIVNREGRWELRNKKAIHTTFLETLQKQIASSVAASGNTNNGITTFGYALSDVTYNEQPCYKVTTTLTEGGYAVVAANVEKTNKSTLPQLATSAGTNDPQTHVPAINLEAKNQIPYIIEYIIDKKTNIIWSHTEYTKAGDILSKQTFSEVAQGLPLADDLFVIPGDYKKMNADTFNDYIQMQKQK